MHLASLPIMLLLFSLLRVMKGRALQQRPMSTTKQRLVMRMCSFGDGPAAEDPLVRHLVGRGSEITPYWIDKLRGIRRPKVCIHTHTHTHTLSYPYILYVPLRLI